MWRSAISLFAFLVRVSSLWVSREDLLKLEAWTKQCIEEASKRIHWGCEQGRKEMLQHIFGCRREDETGGLDLKEYREKSRFAVS